MRMGYSIDANNQAANLAYLFSTAKRHFLKLSALKTHKLRNQMREESL